MRKNLMEIIDLIEKAKKEERERIIKFIEDYIENVAVVGLPTIHAILNNLKGKWKGGEIK